MEYISIYLYEDILNDSSNTSNKLDGIPRGDRKQIVGIRDSVVKKKENGKKAKWTESLKISTAWKTVFEVATSDLSPRMYNRSNLVKSYRNFK